MDDWFDLEVDRRNSLLLALQAAAIFLAGRVLMIPAFLAAWRQQGPNRSSYPTGPPDFLTFLSLSWAGHWYHLIALQGYPSTLPLDPQTGAVVQNQWAFYPLYPSLVRVVMWLGPPYQTASVLVSLTMGVAAMVVLAFLVRDAAAEAVARRPGLPLLAVAALSAFPSGAVAVVGYSETTALLLIVTALALIHHRQYLWAVAPVLLLGFARGVALPMLAVVIWHGICRYRGKGGVPQIVTRSDRIKLPALALIALLSGVAWPAIAGWVTREPNAYLRTDAAWRVNAETARPFISVVTKLSQWTGSAAWMLLALVVVGLIALSLSRPAWALGPELQAWGASYLVYIAAVADLGSPIFRFALLSITLPLGLVAWSRKRWVQLLMIGLLLALQVVWIVHIWVFSGRGDAFPP